MKKKYDLDSYNHIAKLTYILVLSGHQIHKQTYSLL